MNKELTESSLLIRCMVSASSLSQAAIHWSSIALFQALAALCVSMERLAASSGDQVIFMTPEKPALAGSTVALLLMNIWPFVALLTTHGVTRALNGASVMLIVLLFWTSTGYAFGRLGYVLAFPAAVLLFVYIMWRSALVAVVRGTVTWRGTAYPLAQMRANRV